MNKTYVYWNFNLQRNHCLGYVLELELTAFGFKSVLFYGKRIRYNDEECGRCTEVDYR